MRAAARTSLGSAMTSRRPSPSQSTSAVLSDYPIGRSTPFNFTLTFGIAVKWSSEPRRNQ